MSQKTLTLKDAHEIANELVRTNGRGFDWLSYKRYRNQISPRARVIATELLSYNPELHAKLKKAIETELKSKINNDWVIRAFSLLCDPDDNGNFITVDILKAAQQARLSLGYDY